MDTNLVLKCLKASCHDHIALSKEITILDRSKVKKKNVTMLPCIIPTLPLLTQKITGENAYYIWKITVLFFTIVTTVFIVTGNESV